MERIHPSARPGIARDLLLARRAIATGTTAAHARDRAKYWKHWEDYVNTCKINPFLHSVPPLERDIILSGFAARIRAGSYGRARPIKVSSVQDGLSAVTKTLELAAQCSPIHRFGTDKYTTTFARLIEGWRREDPPVVPQLAVPVSVPNYLYTLGHASKNPKLRAVGNLSLIAFYYLLRIGEYTKPKFVYQNGLKVRASRTVQFTIGNIGFFKGGKIVSRSSSLDTLQSCDAATLKITNQKNGQMGDVIHHEAVKGSHLCPIQALAHQVHQILSNGGTSESYICTYFDETSEEHTVSNSDIVQAVRAATNALDLKQQAIDPALVGSHSLQAGGAMAMKLHGASDTTIQKYGRWRSTTFLMYIHTQIAHLAAGVSTLMSKDLPFTNIAAIEAGG